MHWLIALSTNRNAVPRSSAASVPRASLKGPLLIGRKHHSLAHLRRHASSEAARSAVEKVLLPAWNTTTSENRNRARPHHLVSTINRLGHGFRRPCWTNTGSRYCVTGHVSRTRVRSLTPDRSIAGCGARSSSSRWSGSSRRRQASPGPKGADRPWHSPLRRE